MVLGLRSNHAEPPCEKPNQLNRMVFHVDTMPYFYSRLAPFRQVNYYPAQ